MVGSVSSRGGSKSKSRRKKGSKKGYGKTKSTYGGGGYGTMYTFAIVGVLAVGGVFGWLLFRPLQGETQGAACAILVDRTGSSISEVTRSSYITLAGRMVDGCRSLRGSFSVYYFDNQDSKIQAASSEPFDLWRPKAHRESTGDAMVAEAMQGALDAVESVFATAPANSKGGHGSDIVTALSLASQSLQQQAAHEGVEKKYLVVLTDGYQTGELRVGETSDVAALLQRTDQLGLVPQLSGVELSFGGVGGGVASNKSQVSPEREARVKSYWTDLATAGGGTLCVYNVEPAYLPGAC